MLMNTITSFEVNIIFEKIDIKHLGKILVKLNTKMTKIDYISKTKNCTKKSFMQKNERQINSNLLCKFGHF